MHREWNVREKEGKEKVSLEKKNLQEISNYSIYCCFSFDSYISTLCILDALLLTLSLLIYLALLPA